MAGGVFAALAIAVPAGATPTTTWKLTTNCTQTTGTGSNCIGDGSSSVTNGNVYSFKGYQNNQLKNNVSLNAEAYHIAPSTSTTKRVWNGFRWVNQTVTTANDPLNTALQKDFLGYYGAGYGLGVENLNSPEHAVDNSKGWDFVIFQLPAGTNYNTFDITLTSWGTTQDMNATVLYGTPDPSLNITSLQSFYQKTVNQLKNGGFQSMNFSGPFLEDVNGTRTISVTSNAPISYLIVAASLTPLRVTDNFKVTQIVGSTVVRVPEPAAVATLGMGLLGAGAFASRRRKAAKRA